MRMLDLTAAYMGCLVGAGGGDLVNQSAVETTRAVNERIAQRGVYGDHDTENVENRLEEVDS